MAASAPDPAQLHFVLEPQTSGIMVSRRPAWDIYTPAGDRPAPIAVFVHGPVRGTVARPRGWPVYRGYGFLAANAGIAGAVADLDYSDVHELRTPIAELDALIAAVREEDRVDSERVAIWAFSGGARLVRHWFEAPPAWLKGIALTYPVVPNVEHVQVPVVLTRVGREHPRVQASVDQFLAVAPATEVIRLDNGQHGFDMLDHNRQSQQAVTAAMSAVVRLLLT